MLNLSESMSLAVLKEVFASTGDAVVVTDRNNLIVATNPAFTELTGYTEEDVLGHDPKLLASGRTSLETYHALWDSLNLHGQWEGEIWDRSKDGTTFPRWARLRVLPNEEGAAEYYVGILSPLPDRDKAMARMVHLAQHDSLTGLLNRAGLMSQLQLTLNRAHRMVSQAALLLLDLDRFKTINDTLGHDVGDQLLAKLGKRLQESVRGSDLVARLGGDEFVVVLGDIDNAMSVAGVASKIKHSLEDYYQIGPHTLYVTPSVGVAIFPMDGDNVDTLLKCADTAMYHAKAAGRNTIQFFSPAMNQASRERARIEDALRLAIESAHLGGAQFQVWFQPQIHLAEHRVVSLEALARWIHPEWGMVPTSQFITVAEETGLIQPLGDWVFWEACRQLRYFRDQGLTGFRLAVNLSAQQLRYEGLPAVVHGALACYDLTPNDLELEITEATAMQNPSSTMAILGQLSEMGIVLSMDDFGTGYSSLSYLKHLPIHRIKLDRVFVKNVESDKEDSAICSATVALSHALGLEISAEGVETEGQRAILAKLGCDILQGFLYSKPLPAEDLLPFLREFQVG